jgi:hypothetical protein
MVSIVEIPLKVGQPQTLSITINNVTYNLSLKWFELASLWLLDIADNLNNPIVVGVPLVTGADLLGQYKHLGFGFGIWCSTDGIPDQAPIFSSLGDNSHVYAVLP